MKSKLKLLGINLAQTVGAILITCFLIRIVGLWDKDTDVVQIGLYCHIGIWVATAFGQLSELDRRKNIISIIRAQNDVLCKSNSDKRKRIKALQQQNRGLADGMWTDSSN